jgi:hypothetical protein
MEIKKIPYAKGTKFNSIDLLINNDESDIERIKK